MRIREHIKSAATMSTGWRTMALNGRPPAAKVCAAARAETATPPAPQTRAKRIAQLVEMLARGETIHIFKPSAK